MLNAEWKTLIGVLHSAFRIHTSAFPPYHLLVMADESSRKRVIVIGAGFGGMNCVKGLSSSKLEVILIDRHNYHLFQPLLYQVATAALSPADIAYPIRRVFRAQRNVR